jgi:integrase
VGAESCFLLVGAFRVTDRLQSGWTPVISQRRAWRYVAINAVLLAPHDLRRTCARLCHLAGGELDQIQFLLGHVSIQTTERYLGCKQKLRVAVNDRLEIEPDAA